jgi:hypothetical protein
MQSKEERFNFKKDKTNGLIKNFSGQFWLVVMLVFFERGAYYGMMSFISQYFVNSLGFTKEDVGAIKGVIQPLLYSLPIRGFRGQVKYVLSRFPLLHPGEPGIQTLYPLPGECI